MDRQENILSLPTIADKTRFWMIRTKNGFFFDEFISKGFIAIGWNLIKSSTINIPLSKDQAELLKQDIKDEYDEKLPGTAINKCIKFCKEIKVGDIAVIVGRDRISFATIGDYYEADDPFLTVEFEKTVHKGIENANLKKDSFQCPYVKRRKISVINSINAHETGSPYLANALAVNRHSLSDMTEHAVTILSTCYDSYLYKDNLYVTFRVEQEKDINAISLANFIANSAIILSNGDTENVAAKTAVHSVGDIILQIKDFTKDSWPALLICYMAIFGGKFKSIEFNSLVSVIKDLSNCKHTKEMQELEKRKASAECAIAEQQAIALRLANMEKAKELQDQRIENCVPLLKEAAEALKIKSNQAVITSIEELMQKRVDQTDQSPK